MSELANFCYSRVEVSELMMAAGSSPDLETFEKECCVRGYHQYQAIWDAAINEELPCEREATNAVDHYAVAVVKGGQVVGHLPKKS